MLSIKDFAAKIKSKHPEYASVDDTELAQKYLAKFPQYASSVDMGQANTASTNSNQTPPSQQPQQSSGSPLGALGDVSNAIGAGATNLVKGVYDYTAKPVLKGAAMSTIGPAIAGTRGLSNEKDITKPIDVPGLGNINPNTSVANTVGTAADLGSLLIPNSGVLKAGIRGLVQGASKDLQDNPKSDISSTLMRGGTEGIVNAILTPLLHFSLGKVTNEGLGQKGLKMGVPEQYLHELDKLDPAQKKSAVDLIKVGIGKLHNMINGETPFEHAGQPINDFIEKANVLKSQLGETLGAAKDNLSNVKADTAPVKNAFGKVLKKLNITVGPKNTLNFEGSDISGTGADNILQDIYKKIAPYKQMNARDLEAITSQIDTKTGQLTAGGFKPGAFNTHLGNIKSAINSTVGEASPEFQKANQQFAKFINNFSKVTDAAGGPEYACALPQLFNADEFFIVFGAEFGKGVFGYFYDIA